MIVNNACQTVRRPASYYAHLVDAELGMEATLRDAAAGKARNRALENAGAVAEVEGAAQAAGKAEAAEGLSSGCNSSLAAASAVSESASRADLTALFAQQASRAGWRYPGEAVTWVAAGDGSSHSSGATADGSRLGSAQAATPALLSQLRLTPEDHTPLTSLTSGGNATGGNAAEAAGALPSGRLDVNGQQIDLRTTNSWLLTMREVSTPELVEVFAINTLAPFILNARLQPLLAATATRGARQGEARTSGAQAEPPGAAFVVNVSAMEGKFYRHKTPNHPHTNMAKAALNMMTRTSAADLASKHHVFMTAVDTGWINDENPREKAAANAAASHFQTPIDEVDAAARVLHPVFEGVATGKPQFGVFLKDYAVSEW